MRESGCYLLGGGVERYLCERVGVIFRGQLCANCGRPPCECCVREVKAGGEIHLDFPSVVLLLFLGRGVTCVPLSDAGDDC